MGVIGCEIVTPVRLRLRTHEPNENLVTGSGGGSVAGFGALTCRASDGNGQCGGYALRVSTAQDRLWHRVVLVAPTWRGPLPTAMGRHPRVYAALLALVRAPGLGHVPYHINTSKWFLRAMYGRHVFVDQSRLDALFLSKKQQLARKPGARFAASAFVTGTLDPFSDRESCCEALKNLGCPALLVLGKNTPLKSAAEMAAMVEAYGRFPLLLEGSLGMHEEYATALVSPIREFLTAGA